MKLKAAPKEDHGDPTPADNVHVEILASGFTKSSVFKMKPEICLVGDLLHEICLL